MVPPQPYPYPPFFIVGCGRSGTSLLRGLLSNHPEVAIPLESLFIPDYLRASAGFPLEKLKRMIVREPELREWGLQVSVDQLEDANSIAEAIVRLHELYAEAQGKSGWGQKTPRFVRHLLLLQEHFPGARFIHLVRDPRAVARSLIRSDVHRSTAWHAARRWVKDVGEGLAFERNEPDSVLRLRYEELVEDPVKVLQQVEGFLQLKPEPKLAELSAGSEDYSPFYEHIHENLDSQITPAYSDRWREQLSRKQIEMIEWTAGELMAVLGYPTETNAHRPARIDVAIMKARRTAGALFQLWRYVRYRPTYLPRLLWRKGRLGFLSDFLLDLNY